MHLNEMKPARLRRVRTQRYAIYPQHHRRYRGVYIPDAFCRFREMLLDRQL